MRALRRIAKYILTKIVVITILPKSSSPILIVILPMGCFLLGVYIPAPECFSE